jgi:internalin A
MKSISICAGAIAYLLLSVSPLAAAPRPSAPVKSFLQWCQQRNSVSIATKKTIDLLLLSYETKNCGVANAKLSNLTKLNLNMSEISDLRPIAGLTKLTELSLGNNEISDLKPLVLRHQ